MLVRLARCGSVSMSVYSRYSAQVAKFNKLFTIHKGFFHSLKLIFSNWGMLFFFVVIISRCCSNLIYLTCFTPILEPLTTFWIHIYTWQHFLNAYLMILQQSRLPSNLEKIFIFEIANIWRTNCNFKQQFVSTIWPVGKMVRW